MDVQGADVARPYVEKANAEYTTLVDSDNVLGNLFGFKAIPLILLFDESGKLIEGPRQAEVEDDRLIIEMEDWIERGENSVLGKIAANRQSQKMESGFASDEARSHFLKASKYMKSSNNEKALQESNLAFELDPENWLIRKQRWALENPGKFYDGDIDTDWQRELVRINK